MIRSDNGSEFEEGEFQRRLKTLEKPITFELAPSSKKFTGTLETGQSKFHDVVRHAQS